MAEVPDAHIPLPDGELAGWITESDEPAPTALSPIDDSMPAKVAVRRLKGGEVLLWTGDYHNGRQLLKAIKKRLTPRARRNPASLTDQWRAERAKTSRQAQVLGRLVVALESDGALNLRRAPDTRQAVHWAWDLKEQKHLVPLRTLIGSLGSAGWRREGVEVQGLHGRIYPWYGVFSPTRQVYISLLEHIGEVADLSILDVGCGTGVLSFVLLQRGAAAATGTDIEERAVRCAQFNGEALGLDARFQAVQADLFLPEQRFDRIVFNAPWMLGTPATRLDRAIFDAGGQTLRRWLTGLPAHLNPQGVGLLLLSDLPERLGLRGEEEVEAAIEQAGLHIQHMHTKPARHGKAKDIKDPLHQARAAEQIRLYTLSPR